MPAPKYPTNDFSRSRWSNGVDFGVLPLIGGGGPIPWTDDGN